MNQKINEFDNKLVKKDEILEEVKNINLDKKQIESQLNKPAIKNIEKEPMIIPKNPGITNEFLKDNLKASDFLRNLMKNDYSRIFTNQENIYNFLNTINKKIKEDEYEEVTDKKVTLSDFINDKQPVIDVIDQDKLNKMLDSVLNNYSDLIKKPKNEDVETIPLFHNDNDTDFKVMDMCYEEKTQDKSNIKSTEVGNYDSQDENEYNDEDDSEEEDNEEEERVLVIKEPDNSEKINELNELKEKFTNKINLYKEEAKKLWGEKDYNKVFDYYMQISEVEYF